MKNYLIFLFLAVSLFSYADPDEIILTPTSPDKDHFNYPAPVDAPDVYYNSTTQQVIIDGTGFVNYYDVEICSATSWNVVVSTQVNGSYDTIDISSLPTGEYYITIDSPTGNTYEGFFDTY
jgi:hypothetical protein